MGLLEKLVPRSSDRVMPTHSLVCRLEIHDGLRHMTKRVMVFP
jgi:hypothetical protein